MKILTLIGSYRKNGNTSRVVNLLQKQLEVEAQSNNSTLEIETIHLGDLDLNFCRGCRACFDRGEDYCPLHSDDAAQLAQKMHAADGLIIATPVYVNDVSGLVKIWMDRLAYACHRPQFHGKCALMVSTVGTGIQGFTFYVLGTGITSWGYTLSGKLGITGGALTSQAELEKRYHKHIQHAASKLIRDIENKRYLYPSFSSLITFAVQQIVWRRREDEDTVDARYWREQGWTNPKMKYYLPPKTNPLVVGFSRLIGRVVSKFVN